MKKAFKLASRASFRMAKCLYLFQIDQFSQKFQFFAGIFRWWHVQSAVHVTTRLILPELTRSTTFVWKIRGSNRIRQDSLGLKRRMWAQYFVVRSSYFYFSLKYVGWLYVPSQGHITTYRYFFAQEWKKPLNLPVERHLQWLNAYIFLKLLSSLRNFKFKPEMSDGDMYNKRYSRYCGP